MEAREESKYSRLDDDRLDAFRCPITLQFFSDPVVAADGQTYEREAIEKWFARNTNPVLSPSTNEPLKSKTLVPNYALKSALDQILPLILRMENDITRLQNQLDELRPKRRTCLFGFNI